MKLTFKTEKPTGKWRAFGHAHHYIKLDGKKIGTIDDDHPYRIRLMVFKDNSDLKDVNNNPNCDWKWVRLAKNSESVLEAKIFLKNNIEEIVKLKIRKEDT